MKRAHFLSCTQESPTKGPSECTTEKMRPDGRISTYMPFAWLILVVFS